MRETQAEAAVERRIVTVLFCDLVGFTSLSEALDAEDVATIQDAYFEMVRETVGRYGGRLEKFIGDAAMAVFGLPRARDDDVERAVRAGLAIVGGIQQIGARLGLDDSALRVRVGVNTGEAVAAAAGPDEGRVTGDTVNTAARLQTAAAPMTVYVGEATALAVADIADLESMGAIELKGKAEPTPAWAVTGFRPEASRERAMGALRAPTLGRETELAALAQAWQHAVAGAVERWLIVAPPGVGKTRLLRDLAEASERDGIVWRTRARPDSLSPFDPIAGLLRAALSSTGLASDDTAGLRDRLTASGSGAGRAKIVADAVASVLAPAASDGRPAEDRDALFSAWLDALDALAAPRPAAFLIEDVHWAGGDVLAFVELAGSRGSADGRLVVATARPSILETHPGWATADEAAGQHLLNLATLAEGDAQALIRALVGDALPADLTEKIAERSDGNCLFIEELLRTWVSVGALVPGADGTGWRLAVSADEIPLPTSVQSIYAAQLDDLPPDARLLARRASVAGRRFPVRALEPLGASDGADAALGPLRRRNLVTGPVDEAVWGASFAYRHALLRDAGYASLAKAERARLHARLARWLELAAGEHTDEIAESIAGHYANALESTPTLAREIDEGLDRASTQRLAAEWFERAGTAALALSAYDAAHTLFRRAIDLTFEGELLQLARRWERVADATAYADDMDEGAAAYQRANDLYRAVIEADPANSEEARRGLATSVSSLCDVWYQQLRFAEARDLANATLNELGDVDPGSEAALLIGRAYGAQGAVGANDASEADLERALVLARSANAKRVELKAFLGLAVVRSEAGRGDVSDWETVENMATAVGDWTAATAAISNAASMLLDDHASAVPPRLVRARTLTTAHARVEEAGWLDYVESEVAFVSGEWDRALEIGGRTVDLGIANAYRRLTVRTWHVLVPIALVRGDRDLLQRAADWYDSLTGPFPDSPYARIMRPAQDLSFAEVGIRPGHTLEVEPRVVSYEDEPGGPSWTAAADMVFRKWLEAGEIDGAARIFAAMTAAQPRYPNVSALGRGTYQLLRGRLAFAQGDEGQAREAASAALGHFRVSNAPWWMAKAIRLGQRAGLADDALAAEVDEIERALGAVAPTA